MRKERHVGAYGVCLRDGQLLVIRKARGPYTGRFDLPGGGIEFGERPSETVVRECSEETGVQVVVEGLRRLLSCLVLLVLLTACTSRPAAKVPALPEGWPSEADAIIFQADPQGGLMRPVDWNAQVPWLTLLADGRLIYLDLDLPEARFRQATLSPERLALLYEKLQREMAGVEGRYQGGHWTDDATTFFYFWRPDGAQSAEVYAFTRNPSEDVEDRDALTKLRQVWSSLLAAAGESSPLYTPEAALIVAALLEPDDSRAEGEVRDWPQTLPALSRPAAYWEPLTLELSGPEAAGLIEAVPYFAQPIFRQGSDLYEVRVVPRIPLPDQWQSPRG